MQITDSIAVLGLFFQCWSQVVAAVKLYSCCNLHPANHIAILSPSTLCASVHTLCQQTNSMQQSPLQKLTASEPVNKFPKPYETEFLLLCAPQPASCPCPEEDQSCCGLTFCPITFSFNIILPFRHRFCKRSVCCRLPVTSLSLSLSISLRPLGPNTSRPPHSS